ncbi:hydroquinone glucosyltransferase protein [Dioscorea alata]|uniref:Hydroquinone glucosyltransferase protein n=1 Tax=Dioscorea alata TaxID=55571 RepID=A0ACB7UD74_DIOAL|nr:hydroquinone glucosyltransferase protein [Dioscorea alata]
MESPFRSPHIAILPTPGMGHLIPIAELAKLLVSHHGFSVTFITFAESASNAQQAFLDALPSTITSIQLPPVSLSDLPSGTAIETLISLASLRSLPALRSILLDLQKSTNLVAFIADLFGADTFDVAKELQIPPYMFFPSNLLLLSLLLHLPDLDTKMTCEFKDLPTPVELPGCVPIPGTEILQPLQDRSNECYSWMVHHGRKYREATGIIVNSFSDVEPEAAKIFFQSPPGFPPVHLVGPLVQTGLPNVEGSECLKWLDEQPSGSVLYVSFGSGGVLTCEQTVELACGLEMSGQRFLWVIRSPSDKASETYFSATSKQDPFSYLPEGFLERTKKVGFVVPSWAPQMQVLAHTATGGFLSHCGWNSTLESLSHAVPMIGWPLYAEQKMNAVMLSEGTKLALRLRPREDGVYGREEISRVVKELMEGEEGKKVRGRARELQAAAVKAVAYDGESCKTLGALVEKWKKSVM